MNQAEWAEGLARFLKRELAGEGLTFAQLAQRLCALGAEETEASVKNKFYRRTFSGVFVVQCLAALGHKQPDFGVLFPADMALGKALDDVSLLETSATREA